MNPKAYCIEHGMKSADFIEKVREVAPKYSKITHCMASNPEYGVQLTPAVNRRICGKTEKRSRPCKFTFRLFEADSGEFNDARRIMGHNVQQAVECAVKLYIEKAAREAGTSQGGKQNIPYTG